MIAENKELEKLLLKEHALTKYIKEARKHSFTHREEVEEALKSSLDLTIWRAFYWDCTDDPNLWMHVHAQAEKSTLTIVHYEKSNKIRS